MTGPTTPTTLSGAALPFVALPQTELLARAAKAQEKWNPRYDLKTMAGERRLLTRPTGKILTDDFAPVETMRAIEKNNEKWKEQTEVPR